MKRAISAWRVSSSGARRIAEACTVAITFGAGGTARTCRARYLPGIAYPATPASPLPLLIRMGSLLKKVQSLPTLNPESYG